MADIHAAMTEQQTERAEGRLRVVLVNNMADAALAITERRFQRLLQSAFPQADLDFRCVTLPQIPRGEMAAARITRHYTSLDDMLASPPEAVLFSGAEPICRSLRDEIFWPGLVALFDWVRAENIPSLFSCLAAHAAVLHYAGIERRRLPQKMFGTYAQSVTTRHALLRDHPDRFLVPHSRWNDVSAADLMAAAYQVLTQGEQTGVDMFVPADGAPQIFLQGHPEYEENALMSEYNRDLRRFESGQSDYKPKDPKKEDWGSSALVGPAYTPVSSPQAPKPPGSSISGFETILRNWIQQKKEMVA
jgi:homoserine O-succinyltransferase